MPRGSPDILVDGSFASKTGMHYTGGSFQKTKTAAFFSNSNFLYLHQVKLAEIIPAFYFHTKHTTFEISVQSNATGGFVPLSLPGGA
jgi:hypothetical protein